MRIGGRKTPGKPLGEQAFEKPASEPGFSAMITASGNLDAGSEVSPPDSSHRCMYTRHASIRIRSGNMNAGNHDQVFAVGSGGKCGRRQQSPTSSELVSRVPQTSAAPRRHSGTVGLCPKA